MTDSNEDFKMGEWFKGRVVGIVEFKGKLFVALETGVFVKGDDDVFRKLQFEQIITGAEND
jgi:hypothetical protein